MLSREARQRILATLAVAGLVCLVLALCRAGWNAGQHGYLQAGYLRTVGLVLAEELARITPWTFPGAVVAVALCGWRQRRRRDGLRCLPWLLGLLAGGWLFFSVAEPYNRAHAGRAWLLTRDFHGLALPRALWRGDVWLANLLLGLGAVAAAVLVWYVLRRLFKSREQVVWRWWRLLQRTSVCLVVLLLFGAPFRLAHGLRVFTSERPNIVLVSLDTLRADHLRLYGHHRLTSPFLDNLAAQGFIFDWAFSPAASTPPAHMSLFTSTYPTVHGYLGDGNRLPPRFMTLAEHLREHGYRTFATTDGGYLAGGSGFADGFERYEDSPKGIAESVPLVLRWLDEDLASDNFFLFIHCYDVHSPYESPPPYNTLFADSSYSGAFQPTAQALEQLRRRLNREPGTGHGLSADEVKYMEARYDEGIRYTDEWIGELLRGLRDRGRLADTWVVVLSDHGEEFTEHGSVLHEKLYHTVTRIPLIIRPPGVAGEAQVISRIVELTDLMPTFLEIADAPGVGPIQGESLLGIMENPAAQWKNVAFSEVPWYGRQRALTTPGHHLLLSLDSGEMELYRYRGDPLEQKPVGDNALPGEREELLARLRAWAVAQLELAGDEDPAPAAEWLDPQTERQLRALGYLE
ncbi:MAG: sulfatase-like hydrolase/transferase [bacterium]